MNKEQLMTAIAEHDPAIAEKLSEATKDVLELVYKGIASAELAEENSGLKAAVADLQGKLAASENRQNVNHPSFEKGGRTYQFVTGEFLMRKRGKVKASDAVNNEELLNEILKHKLGVVVETTPQNDAG